MHQLSSASGDFSSSRNVLDSREPHEAGEIAIRTDGEASPTEGGPSVVRRVDEIIYTGLREPLNAGEIAARVGVSARTLFRTYRRYRGRSPIQALRAARLERVRGELLRAKPETTVSRAALEWGFSHLGRFSETYRKAYGELPSATLRRARLDGMDGMVPGPRRFTVEEHHRMAASGIFEPGERVALESWPHVVLEVRDLFPAGGTR